MKRILVVLFSLLAIFSCSSKKESTANGNEKVFYLSGELVGTGDKIPYIWQDGSGILPNLLYRTLLISDGTFENYSPDLASEYVKSDDDLNYTFTLKDNLKWSDGEKITPEDVKFSLQTALKVSIINGIFPEAITKIVGAKEYKEGKAKDISGIVIDNNKISISLTEPVGEFLRVIAQFFIFPKHSLEKENPLELHNSSFWSHPVTGGMYKVTKVEPGNFIELSIDDNYENEKPKIQKVVYNFITDPILAIKDGKSYFYTTNKPKEINQLSEIDGIIKKAIDIQFYRYFIMNLSGIDGKGNSRLTDKRVREAILYAIDKKSLADKLFPEIATLNYTGIPTNLEGYLKEANTYEYNPEKAKALLKEANFDFSKPLIITYYYKDQTSADFLQAIAFQLEQVGIKAQVTQIQSDPTKALFQLRKYDIGYKGFSSFGYQSWYGEYSSKNTNFKNIYNSDTSFDELIVKLSKTTDKDKRKEILLDLQKLEQEKLYKLPLYTFKNFIFINGNKVVVPSDLEFSNPFYRYDYKFEKWDVK